MRADGIGAGADVAEAFLVEVVFADPLAVQQQEIGVQSTRHVALVDELEAAAAAFELRCGSDRVKRSPGGAGRSVSGLTGSG